jgi:hypothetical protein
LTNFEQLLKVAGQKNVEKHKRCMSPMRVAEVHRLVARSTVTSGPPTHVAVADYFVWPWLMQHVRLFCVCLQDNFPLQVEKAGPAPRNADELEVRIRAA